MIKKTIINLLRKTDDFIFNNFGSLRILFIVRNQLGMSCLLPIIREMQTKDNIKIAITEEYKGCYKWSDNEEISCLYRKYFIQPDLCTYKKWHFVLTSDVTNLWFKRNTTIIFTHHGNAYGNLDKIYENNDTENYMENLVLTGNHSIYFSNSYNDYKYIKNIIAYGNRKKSLQLFISGFAKIDQLVQSTRLQGEEFLQSINLQSDKKTVVISSHWCAKSLLNALGSGFIETVCSIGPNYNIIVSGHGNLWIKNDNDLYNKIKSLEEKFNQLRFLPNIDTIIGFLRSGDVFIGDNSSILIEYCLMDKPILFFHHPDFIFSDQLVGELFKNAALSFSDKENITALIKSSLENPDENQKNRKIAVDHFLSNRGNATKYIVDMIIRLGRISKDNKSDWQKVEDLSNSEISHFENQLRISK